MSPAFVNVNAIFHYLSPEFVYKYANSSEIIIVTLVSCPCRSQMGNTNGSQSSERSLPIPCFCKQGSAASLQSRGGESPRFLSRLEIGLQATIFSPIFVNKYRCKDNFVIQKYHKQTSQDKMEMRIIWFRRTKLVYGKS